MTKGTRPIDMKLILSLLLALATFSGGGSVFAAEKADAKEQLKTLISKIRDKLSKDQKTEAALADELKEFDKLLEQHKGEKTEDVAQILYMKAMLYVEILDSPEKGMELIRQLKKDFPDTEKAKESDRVISSLERQAEAAKIQRKLAVGVAFPDFKEKDVDGKPLSISAYKGKVLLVDFWATWCGPCVAELPNVLKTYEKHHSKGFEILGISLDREEKALRDFTKKHSMPWQQYFDGKGWENKLSGVYGVMSIPATFLLDKEGKIAAKNLRGDALEQEVAKLVGK
jgi:peroxiredoxin